MKVATVNYTDVTGGAARAAYRIHHALRLYGIDSIMMVNHAYSGDWTVNEISKWEAKKHDVRRLFGRAVVRLLKTKNPITHSPALISSNWPKILTDSDTDIVHMHWINNEMLSVRDIGGINKPTVWTLHDMWAFCGAEHYTDDLRWRDGYNRHNRPAYEAGFDLNRWVWRRKLKGWKRPIHIVTPSAWLADCVRQSVIMRDWPLTVIPNAIDTDVWKPVEKKIARKLLQLPIDAPLLLFGAMGGSNDPRKGFDLLRKTLQYLRGSVDEMQLVIFGQRSPRIQENLGFRVHYLGHLHDDVALKLLYSAADAMVIPSRQDNLPNTGLESLACGTPVVAFDACGLPDIVSHLRTGYLARAYDPEDLANGINHIISDEEKHRTLSINARQFAVEEFSYPVVASKYAQAYKVALESQ